MLGHLNVKPLFKRTARTIARLTADLSFARNPCSDEAVAHRIITSRSGRSSSCTVPSAPRGFHIVSLPGSDG